MKDQDAQNIFEEIQARPFRIGLSPTQETQNCFFKGIELIQRLGVLGYTVRGRVGETYWDSNLFGQDVTGLLPDDILVTHFVTEIYQDGGWRILDPSFQPSLQQYGLTIGSWEGGECCFPITKLYSQEESIAYQQTWFDPANQKKFFEDGGACWASLDQWFKERA